MKLMKLSIVVEGSHPALLKSSLADIVDLPWVKNLRIDKIGKVHSSKFKLTAWCIPRDYWNINFEEKLREILDTAKDPK